MTDLRAKPILWDMNNGRNEMDAKQIDTRIAQLGDTTSRLANEISSYDAQVSRLETRIDRTDNADSIEYLGKQIDQLRDEKAQVVEAHRATNAEWQSEHDKYTGWNRYYHVMNTNGHVHTSMHCSSCFFNTEYSWLVANSDDTHESMVAEFGFDMCTVCIPNAPALPGFNTSKSSAEKQAARDAKKTTADEKAAKKAAKALVAPLDVEHHGRAGTIKTIAAAKTALRSELELQYGRSRHQEAMRNIANLLDALEQVGLFPEHILADAIKKAAAADRKNAKHADHLRQQMINNGTRTAQQFAQDDLLAADAKAQLLLDIVA